MWELFDKLKATMALSSSESFYEEPDTFPMSLSAFLERYGTKLPQVVAINESIYGVCGGSLSNDQPLQIYFKREAKVVNVRLSRHNYIIPVSSYVKASVVYNPHNNLEKAKEGYYFDTVADLIKAVPQPFVVSVGKNWISSKDSSQSLQKGQILLIKGIDLSDRKEKILNCIITESSTSVHLEETCKGHFTTQPSLIAIDLKLLLQYINLPIHVSLHHKDVKFQKWLKNEIGVINEYYVLQSIIASTKRCYHDEVPCELVEILSSVPIDVRIIQISEEIKIQLNISAQKLARILKPSVLTKVVTDVSPVAKIFQQDILMSIPEREWRNGVHNIRIGEYQLLPQRREVEQLSGLNNLTSLSHSCHDNSWSHCLPKLPIPKQVNLPPRSKTKEIIPVVHSYTYIQSSTDIAGSPCIREYEETPFASATNVNSCSGYAEVSSGITRTVEFTSLTISERNEMLLKEVLQMRHSIAKLTASIKQLENTINGMLCNIK